MLTGSRGSIREQFEGAPTPKLPASGQNLGLSGGDPPNPSCGAGEVGVGARYISPTLSNYIDISLQARDAHTTLLYTSPRPIYKSYSSPLAAAP
jgi:hypothetical protein